MATVGVPKAGVFAEGAARIVAAELIAAARGEEDAGGYDGLGSCYIEFGAGRVGRVDVDFLSGPKPTGAFHEPSADPGRREGALRLQPPRPLVRALRHHDCTMHAAMMPTCGQPSLSTPMSRRS